MERLNHFDSLRGFAILMVVAIHTYQIKDGDVDLFFRQFLNCAVPIFLAISGFFLAQKSVNTAEKYRIFLTKQIPKVYIPVLIWSLPLLALDFFKGGVNIKDVVMLFVCGYSIYYFVALIIQYYLLLPFIQQVTNRQRGRWIMACISMICVFIVTYIFPIMGCQLPLVVYAGPCILWIVFFAEGIYIGNLQSRDFRLSRLLIAAIILLVLQFVESKLLMTHGIMRVGIKPSSFLFSGIVIVVLFSSDFESVVSKFPFFCNILIRLGRASFGIYLIHVYVINVMSKFLCSLNDYWVLRCLFVASLSFLVVFIVNKALPRRICGYIGFRY